MDVCRLNCYNRGVVSSTASTRLVRMALIKQLIICTKNSNKDMAILSFLF